MNGRRKTPWSIALVFPGCADGLGGAESQALEFLRRYDRSELTADLVLLGDNPTFARRARQIEDLVVHVLSPEAGHVWNPRVLAAYVRLLRRRRYHLVHLYGLRQEVMTRPWSRLGGRPRVVSAIRGTEDHRGAWQRLLNRGTGRWVDLWIANSVYARDVFVARDRLPSNKIAVVHNGVPVASGAVAGPATGAEFVIGCVANHLPAKRLEDLITAVGGLVATGVDARLSLVGRHTAHTDVLQRSVAVAGLQKRVDFLGYRSDVAELMHGYRVVALPSAQESFPSSLLEAMAVGLPVVAAATAGIPEMVVDGVTGWLHAPGDIPALQEHLARLARDPELGRRMGQAGAERVRAEFSVAQLVARVTAQYRNLLQTGEPAS